MKKIGLFFVFIVTLSQLLQAQTAPSAFNYSAVARDAESNPISNQTIGIQISILKSSTIGSIVFQENHFVNTNESGLFNLIIGTGTVLKNSISSIDWGNDDYFIKVGMDASGGTNFLEMGTTQLLSVPYALYAESSGNKLIVSDKGDTLRLSGNNYVIIPGISYANGGSSDDGDEVDTGDGDDDDATDDDDGIDDEGYDIPSTYDFGESVSYGGQTDRLDMLELLKAEVSKSHIEGAAVSATTLKNMFVNAGDGSAFDDSTGTDGQVIGSSGKNLSAKTEGLAKDAMYDILDEVAQYSGIMSVGNSAGLVARGDKYILVNDKGQEYAQLVQKGLMGSCFYNQIVSNYLSDPKIGEGVENTTKEEGKNYTEKQHHFDEAFGYFGIPTDWNTSTEDVARFWGKYCNKRNERLVTNSIFEDFIAGRAAIAHDVHANQIEPVKNIISKIEKVAAGTAIYYFNKSKAQYGGDQLHSLTEGLCFLRACMYGNSDAKVTIADVVDIEELLNGGNFWTITNAQIDAAVAKLAAVSGLPSDL